MTNTEETNHRRLPAEWEGNSAILLSWPHADSDWADMLDEVTRCYVELTEAISRFHPVLIVAPDIEIPKRELRHLGDRKILFCQVKTNDTWTRDFGPITVFDCDGNPLLLDFSFNGWGLKFAANYDNLVTSKLVGAKVLDSKRENHLGFVLEGGSIDSDGRGSLLTTSECLLSPNRNGDLNREEIQSELSRVLGVDRVLWIDHGYLAGDDTDSHVDTLARFAPDDTIIYVAAPSPDDEHYHQLKLMEEDISRFTTTEGRPYNMIALPMPDAVYDEEGQRLPATYANFLVTDKALFMPVYGQPQNDYLASQILKIAFPGHVIVAVNCLPLVKQHGSLHCATIQFPMELLP